MKLVIASDHAGFELKQELMQDLDTLKMDYRDLGAFTYEPLDDYPDFAQLVGEAILRKEADRGVLICGSGVGVCIAANKIPGVRASMCHDTYSAHQGVEHDDMNVLVLGARIIGGALAHDLLTTFLNAVFQKEQPRFVRRFNKVLAIEKKYQCAPASQS